MSKLSRKERMARSFERNGVMPATMVLASSGGSSPLAEDATDPEQVLGAAGSLLQATALRAFDDRDHMAVVRAVDVWTKVTGGRVAETHQHQHQVQTNVGDDYHRLPPREQLAQLLEARAVLDEEIARLQAVLDAEAVPVEGVTMAVDG